MGKSIKRFILCLVCLIMGFSLVPSENICAGTENYISDCIITLSKTSYVYTGSACKPTVTVKYGDKTLKSGTDYTVKYSNNTYPGTGNVTIIGQGSYKGSVKRTFKINNGLTVSLSKTSYVYTGSACKPTLTVKCGNTKLSTNNYSVTYYNNTKAGTASVVVEGKGTYSGRKAYLTYSIVAKSLSQTTVTLSKTKYTYTGNAIKPSVTVKDGTKILVNDVDYSVKYANNTNAGTATVTITGKGNYTGTVKKSFTIARKAISDDKVTLSKTKYTYTGNAIRPGVTVKDGTKKLVKDTDYQIKYLNNINAGVAVVTVTMKGNYTGTIVNSFVINPITIKDTNVELDNTSYTYNGSEINPGVTVKNDNGDVIEEDNYFVTYLHNADAGTAIAIIIGQGNYTGTVKKTFTIAKKTISDNAITLSKASYTYAGKECEPTVIVKNGTTTLKEDIDYWVRYTRNVNVGTATVTVAMMGNYKGTISKDFVINPITITEANVKLDKTSYTYNGSAIVPNVAVTDDKGTLIKDTNYTVTYKDNTNAGLATVIIIGEGNYTGTVKKSFTIAKRSVSDDEITLSRTSYIYNGKKCEPTVTVKSGAKTLRKDTDYSVKYEGNVNVGTATATVTMMGNYTGTIVKKFTIEPVKLTESNVELNKTNYTYIGSEITPEVTVKDDEGVIIEEINYTVTYANTFEVGLATVTITGIDNYTGTVDKSFFINSSASDKKYDLDEITLSMDDIVENEYVCTTNGKIEKDEAYVRTKYMYAIKPNTFYKTNVSHTTYIACYDDDMRYVGSVKAFAGSDLKAKKTPSNARWCRVTVMSDEIDEMTFQMIDGKDVDLIQVPLSDDDVIYYPNSYIDNKGVVHTDNTEYDIVCIPNVKGKKIYASYNILFNAVFYDENNKIIQDGTAYISCVPKGKMYDIPENAVKVILNIPTAKDPVSGENENYIKVIKDGYKNIAVIGDSITYLDGRNYGGSTPMVGFQGELRKSLNAIVDSYGYSGRPYADYTTSNSSETDSGVVIQDSIYNKIVTNKLDMSNYDMVILFGGANDVRLSIPFGTENTDYKNLNLDPYTFNGAIGGIISYLRKQNPNMVIIICTTLPSASSSRYYIVNKSYRDEIIKNAEFWSVPCLDLFTEMNAIPKSNFDSYFYDSAHPNILGMERIGKIMANFIKNYM